MTRLQAEQAAGQPLAEALCGWHEFLLHLGRAEAQVQRSVQRLAAGWGYIRPIGSLPPPS